jgi:hypothetical protein
LGDETKDDGVSESGATSVGCFAAAPGSFGGLGGRGGGLIAAVSPLDVRFGPEVSGGDVVAGLVPLAIFCTTGILALDRRCGSGGGASGRARAAAAFAPP